MSFGEFVNIEASLHFSTSLLSKNPTLSLRLLICWQKITHLFLKRLLKSHCSVSVCPGHLVRLTKGQQITIWAGDVSVRFTGTAKRSDLSSLCTFGHYYRVLSKNDVSVISFLFLKV